MTKGRGKANPDLLRDSDGSGPLLSTFAHIISFNSYCKLEEMVLSPFWIKGKWEALRDWIICTSSQQSMVKAQGQVSLCDFGTVFQTPDDHSKEQNWLSLLICGTHRVTHFVTYSFKSVLGLNWFYLCTLEEGDIAHLMISPRLRFAYLQAWGGAKNGNRSGVSSGSWIFPHPAFIFVRTNITSPPSVCPCEHI